MILGLKHGTVALYPHDPEWEAEAARTVSRLRAVLGGTATDAQHVGSTSIRSIMAKPIIDVAVAAADIDAVREKQAEMREAGFYYRKNGKDLPEQLLFASGSYYEGTGEDQTHFIHVVRAGGRVWNDYINFRDYMNSHPDAAKEYENLKIRLARECPEDHGRGHYIAGKHAFISRALFSALAWSYLGKTVHIKIDRPAGYRHKTDGHTLVYPVNYGYIPGVSGGDGEELDVYLLGVNEPLREADCRIIGMIRRRNDAEDKLVAAPEGMSFTEDEIRGAVAFQEKWFDTQTEAIK